ncbi:MAG TPA: hypothetical protein VGG84_04190 [Gemmatimonadaceae bacterium]|jgi:uncharacterized membrane-anchored protein
MTSSPYVDHEDAWSKVPRVTLAFWIVKILATTLGETGGDALSMQLNLGYAVSSLIFLAFFAVTLFAQVQSKHYHPVFYWAVVVATTTVGTTTSDYFDRTLGLGYVKSSIILLCLVIVLLVLWRRSTGAIRVDQITDRKDEIFYWVTILVSNTLGTALGDFVATTTGLGFEKGALVFAGLILIVAVLHYMKALPESVLFWAAYVLTRPLGATLGDTLTKPGPQGGLGLNRITSSLVIAAMMIVLIAVTSLRKRASDTPREVALPRS